MNKTKKQVTAPRPMPTSDSPCSTTRQIKPEDMREHYGKTKKENC